MENISLVIAGLPARGDAGDPFPIGVLIDQPFEQVARQLASGRPTALIGSSEAGSSLMWRTISCLAANAVPGGTCAAIALLIQAPIAAAQSAKRKPRCIFLPVIMIYPR